MTKRNFGYRKDVNHDDFGEAFRAMGWSAHDTGRAGDGFPDWTVGAEGRTFLVEVKPPGGKLNANQVAFFDAWQGHAIVAEHPDEAISAIVAELEVVP